MLEDKQETQLSTSKDSSESGAMPLISAHLGLKEDLGWKPVWVKKETQSQKVKHHLSSNLDIQNKKLNKATV